MVRRCDCVRGKSALALPDAHAVGWREVELISGLDIERCVPRVEVAHRSRPELVGGMSVGHYLLAQRGRSRLRCPRLCEGKEELLVARETVLDGSLLVREGGMVCVV